MHLVYDIDAVLSHLRRYLHLLHKRLYVLHAIIRRGIELVNAVGASFRERTTRLALSARLHIGRRIRAVYGLCKNAGRRCLADTTRSTKQICVSELAPLNGILQGSRYVILSDKGLKGVRTILSG